MTSAVKIGLIGLGTVGQGVVRVLKNNAEEISRRAGRPVVISCVSVRNQSVKRDCELNGITVVSDPMSIARDADVDIVVELIGGKSPAKELILTAIQNGKHVVTANKSLLAEDGNAIFKAAREKGVMVAFEAAVAGGIPIIKAIREGLAGNRIENLAGIINGTCNYILTQMTLKGESFADALKAAQQLGYAEADPTFDVGGIDAAHKLTILASIAFGMPLSFDKVAIEGITQVTAQDIKLAQALGYRIKHLGIAKRGADGVELRAHPTLIPEDKLLAKVDGVLNSVLLQGNVVGQIGFYGRGAGGDATASAVVADIVDLVRLLGSNPKHFVPALAFQPDAVNELPVVDAAQVKSAFYLRLSLADEPGVLSQLTAILAEHQISVEAILQREPEDDQDATVALITSEVAEHQFNHALTQMQTLKFVRPGLSKIRVEYFE